MKAILAAAVLAVLVASPASAYQVTGPVDSVSDTTIVVVQEKGKNKGEKFEMARGADTKVSGELKKGAKVTVEYALTAKSIEVKAEKAAKPAKKK
jgi:opacity protein-like surface antigen